MTHNATRRLVDGRPEYSISEDELKRAIHIEDMGWIFDVAFDAWNRRLIVYMAPHTQVVPSE